jgi:hypothetical protein
MRVTLIVFHKIRKNTCNVENFNLHFSSLRFPFISLINSVSIKAIIMQFIVCSRIICHIYSQTKLFSYKSQSLFHFKNPFGM